MSRIKLNVSGTLFEFDEKILQNRNRDRITELCRNLPNEDTAGTVYVGRSAKCFDSMLSFYQTGELHIPLDVCPASFQQEMDFWRLDKSDLAECCSYRLNSFLDEKETRLNFIHVTRSRRHEVTIPVSRNLGYIRARIWSLIDYHERTLLAKIYFAFISLVVLLSILSLALSTEESMRRPMTKCEVLEYMEHAEHDDGHHVAKEFGHLDCDYHHFSTDDYDFMHEIFGDNGIQFYDDHLSENVTITLPKMTVPIRAFYYLDLVMLALFTADVLLRLLSCPCLVDYFLSIVNIVDVIAIISSYVYLVVMNIEREHRYAVSWIHVLNYFQVFRSLRLLRIVKNVRASQVLAYSLKQNFKDIVVLFLFTFFGVSTFACIMYFAEDRDTIPSIARGWYFSIITLTTVGYGDITPKTSLGYVMASVCAIMGIVLLAVTVPIFVNNFLTLYQYAVIDAFTEKQTSTETVQVRKNRPNTVSVISECGDNDARKLDK